jgi:hypothetical protein
MGLLKKNGVWLLGWVVFVGLYYLLVRFPYYYFFLQNQAEFATFENNSLAALLILLGAVFLNFLAFAISLRMVILPIAMRDDLQMIRSKYPLFVEWVIYCIVFIIFCWPIGYVQSLLALSSAPDTAIGMLKPIWQVLVGFGLYRESAAGYVKNFQDQLENTKIQMREPTDTTV